MANYQGKRRSIPKEIEHELRKLVQLIEVAQTTFAGVELVLLRDNHVDPTDIVDCVVQNTADDLDRIGQTIACLIVALGGKPYQSPSEELVTTGPESILGATTIQGRSSH